MLYGLKHSQQPVSAVQALPLPSNVQEFRRYLGLSPYCRKFIPKFVKVAKPLHPSHAKKPSLCGLTIVNTV